MERNRAMVVVVALATGFTALSGKLIHIQVTQHEHYLSRAAEQNGQKIKLPASRGEVVDAHGEVLAMNRPVSTVCVDASVMADPAAMAEVLAQKLGLKKADLLPKFTKLHFSKKLNKDIPDQYIVLKHEVMPEQVEDLKAALTKDQRKALILEPDSVRVYPNGTLLAHVLGGVSDDNRGLAGIEQRFDSRLTGIPGFRVVEKDARGNELFAYRSIEKLPENGNTVRLTVDLGVQSIVESELSEAVKKLKPKAAMCVMMRPKTGELMAMASWPTFDPNEFVKAEQDTRINRVIEEVIEPGSTFKLVANAGYYDSFSWADPEETVFCENGYWRLVKLSDHHSYSDLSVRDILVKSSNIGFAKLGSRLGDQRLYDYIRKFGFGEYTEIPLPGETNGTLHPTHAWTKLSNSRISMGHEVAATPLQIVAAMSAAANGGTLMRPQIVREIVGADGRVVASFPPQVIRNIYKTPASAQRITEWLREAMLMVCSPKGTANLARVSGFRVAGKTGTAQKYDPITRKPRSDRHVCSFVGFMPAEDPEFVCLVVVDEAKLPEHKDTGGQVAAPIFSRIAERTARHLNLVPAPEPLPDGIIATRELSKTIAR